MNISEDSNIVLPKWNRFEVLCIREKTRSLVSVFWQVDVALRTQREKGREGERAESSIIISKQGIIS